MNLTASNIVGGLVLLALLVLMVRRRFNRGHGSHGPGEKDTGSWFDAGGDDGGD